MPNDLLTPSTIARVGLATLYNNFVAAGLVWRDFDDSFAGKIGDTISVRKPAVFTADDFDRATGIVLQDVDEDSVPVKLDKIADVSFPVTAEELTLNIDDFAGRLLNPAMLAIVEAVDTALVTELESAATGTGGGGTETGASASEAMIKAREKLTTNKLPLTERYGVLSPGGTSEALSDELFVRADQSGSTDALRNAAIGRVFGIDTYESQQVPGSGVAFHRTAVTLASRTLQAPNGVGPSQYAIENFMGLGLRVVYSYDIKYKQDIVSVDFLYGVAVTRPEGAVKVTITGS